MLRFVAREVLSVQSPAQYAVQRRYQRYVFSDSLDVIRSLAPNDSRRCPGICMEISEGGMSAIVTDPLNVGDEVQLSFSGAPGKRIVIKAVVRNHYHFRHGFEFVGVTDETREQIRTLCASLRPYEGGWY